jgi:hypothetical protein
MRLLRLIRDIRGKLTDDDYAVRHSGPNRAARRKMVAKIRRSRAKPKRYAKRRKPQPHEARHVFARPASDFPESWR